MVKGTFSLLIKWRNYALTTALMPHTFPHFAVVDLQVLNHPPKLNALTVEMGVEFSRCVTEINKACHKVCVLRALSWPGTLRCLPNQKASNCFQ